MNWFICSPSVLLTLPPLSGQISLSLSLFISVLLVSSVKVICYQSKSHKSNRTLRRWSTKSPDRQTLTSTDDLQNFSSETLIHLSVRLKIHHFKCVFLWISSEMKPLLLYHPRSADLWSHTGTLTAGQRCDGCDPKTIWGLLLLLCWDIKSSFKKRNEKLNKKSL